MPTRKNVSQLKNHSLHLYRESSTDSLKRQITFCSIHVWSIIMQNPSALKKEIQTSLADLNLMIITVDYKE